MSFLSGRSKGWPRATVANIVSIVSQWFGIFALEHETTKLGLRTHL